MEASRDPQATGQLDAGSAAAAATPAAAGASDASTTRLAWEEACEEACEAPQIAGDFSRLLSSQLSFRLSHPRGCAPAVEPAEAAEIKAEEAAPAGWPAWRGEASKLLALAWPISVSARLASTALSRVQGRNLLASPLVTRPPLPLPAHPHACSWANLLARNRLAACFPPLHSPCSWEICCSC